MPSDFLAPLLDPTAPLPAIWPTGAWGAFLLFLIPIGGGIPLGVIMGRDAGLAPLTMAGMYLVSDIVMALTHEPLFWLLGWLASTVPTIRKIRDVLRQSMAHLGLREAGQRGPLGLILFSFTVDPVMGRGAAAMVGHGFLAGWTFSIAGDMIFFGVVMAGTLWLSSVLGDERMTVGVIMLLIFFLPGFLQRRRHAATSDGAPAPRRRSSAQVGADTLSTRPVPVRANQPGDDPRSNQSVRMRRSR